MCIRDSNMTTGSTDAFLRFYESYARSEKNPVMNIPKEPGDFRERVGRDTIKGRYGIFHNNVEMYFY